MPTTDVIANDRSRALKHAKHKLAGQLESRIAYPTPKPAPDRAVMFALGVAVGIGLFATVGTAWLFLQ